MVTATKDHFNLLFTSVGRRVELLRAFRGAYQSLGLPGRIVALDIDRLAPALRLADRPYIVPRLDSNDYLPTLRDICQREKVKYVLPLIDHDIPVLASNRDAIEQTGARVAVVPLKAASCASDKWLTYQFFRRIGLPTPKSWLPDHLEHATLDFPLFIKPRNGSAGKQGFKVNSRDELEFFARYVPDPIIQEFLEGSEVTSDVVCGLNRHVLAVVSRRRIEVRWGEVAKGVTMFDQEIRNACIQIARELPTIGPITVQCMMHKGEWRFTEINARLGGGVPLGIAAGVDSPRLLLAEAAGIPVDRPAAGNYQTGLYMTRFDDSILLTEQQRNDLASSHL